MSSLYYLVKLTAPVTTMFKADNHRGEPRWERNAVDALLTCGKTVHSTNKVWYSELEKPENLHDEIHQEWMRESVQISYGVPNEIYTGPYPENCDPRYRIVQYQDGPGQGTKDTFLKYHAREPGSIVATCSFKAGDYLARLQNVLGTENVVWTFGPTVPRVYTDHSSFSQPLLLWSYRNFCKYSGDDQSGYMRKLYGQISNYLNSDPSLRLVILAQPPNESIRASIEKDSREWFFSLPASVVLNQFRDRVDVLTNIHWFEMLELMSRTRLVVSPAEPLGGPPFEAASYGIPTVLERNTHPFRDSSGGLMFNEVLTANHGASDEFLFTLDRLFYDKDFYERSGNAYRNFVSSHATYEAYVNKLEEIASNRGWEGK